VPGIQALSFADDIGLTTAASSVAQVCTRLQEAGEVAIEWGIQNLIEYQVECMNMYVFMREVEKCVIR
jgi:hypothetical protein